MLQTNSACWTPLAASSHTIGNLFSGRLAIVTVLWAWGFAIAELPGCCCWYSVTKHKCEKPGGGGGGTQEGDDTCVCVCSSVYVCVCICRSGVFNTSFLLLFFFLPSPTSFSPSFPLFLFFFLLSHPLSLPVSSPLYFFLSYTLPHCIWCFLVG